MTQATPIDLVNIVYTSCHLWPRPLLLLSSFHSTSRKYSWSAPPSGRLIHWLARTQQFSSQHCQQPCKTWFKYFLKNSQSFCIRLHKADWWNGWTKQDWRAPDGPRFICYRYNFSCSATGSFLIFFFFLCSAAQTRAFGWNRRLGSFRRKNMSAVAHRRTSRPCRLFLSLADQNVLPQFIVYGPFHRSNL